ncbi:MAG: hypothetical protein EOO50_04250 [Flavobacterium sp.]|uniref:hypothetical protein n=1 Tax=Flavobacterium sp. TaxID=239 RepID=UPI0012097790|nr:hypothetical protein [Flavobacterium sp.]RZJ67794.1 MAG: hypothetical protein EOO50_04250 [Flavobacterium sp.]
MARFSFLLVLFVGFAASAQEFEVPTNFNHKIDSDYAKHENDLIAAVNWLQNTPYSDQKEKRSRVNAFVTKWVEGSPDVKITLYEDIVTFMDCRDCLTLYMGGWAKYQLETNDKSQIKGNVAGLETAIVFYEKNKTGLGRIRGLEKYAKLKEKGKLESELEWILR